MWNYRIGVKKEYDTLSKEYVLLYSIIECYYDENLIPESYLIKSHLCNWESYSDLSKTFNKVRKAFSKPIIDLENFPNIFKNEN